MSDRPSALWRLAGLTVLVGLVAAIAQRWTCDDAFISFRYLDQMLAGHGLVFNPGERVEGYTNFLWVMVLAPLRALGLPLIPLSQVLGLACFVACLGLLARDAWRRGQAPLAVIALALHLHMQRFATCGLETAMFCLLVTAGVLGLIRAAAPGGFAWSGLWLILATMTRPDGAIFYALGSGVVVILSRRARSWRPLCAYALPFVLLYLPYFAWKFSYYGYPVPNTFYAKSASEPYLGQGLYYLRVYLQEYWYLLPGLLAGPWLLWRHRAGDRWSAGDSFRMGLLLSLMLLGFLSYVVWVGGDFMFSRFCLPVTPLLCLGLQWLCSRRGRSTQVALALALCLASAYPAFPKPWLAPGNPNIVAYERDHYPAWYLDTNRILAQRLREVFGPRRLGLALGGGFAMQAWYGKVDYALELNGLTDAFIAHREIEQRGRVGHEKALPIEHPYLAERGVDVIVLGTKAHPIMGEPPPEWRKFEFYVEDVPLFGQPPVSNFAIATLVRYDRAVMDPLLGREDVRFRPFPEYLDTYIKTLPGRDKGQIRRDLADFRRFYFDHNEDPLRLAPIEAAAQ